MHAPSLIEKKRDGLPLSPEEIAQLITSFSSGQLPDYQMAALAMAIYFQGMDDTETAALTSAMLASGSSLSWPAPSGRPRIVDKHSTGGIGDKSSLILAPLLACHDLWVPMISGRGLGITGGTLDKLESIPGFNTSLSIPQLQDQVARIGCAMVGQTADLCPADKKLYALRDVTATVPSIPLIVASIMSKKLAESTDALVLDVKFGTGAFMRHRDQAAELARRMVAVGQAMGVDTTALLNPMDEPIGCAVGNALEVAECVQVLQGQGPQDLIDLVLDLAQPLVPLDRPALAAPLNDGTAFVKFCHMVEAQGGTPADLSRLPEIHRAPYTAHLIAEHGGTLQALDAGALGRAVVALGGGRARTEDAIDPAVGADQIAKVGTRLHPGDPILRLHARTQSDLANAITSLRQATTIA